MEGSAGAYRGVAVVAFGTSAAMWFAGYLCRLPGTAVPGWAVGVLLVVLQAMGGAVAARTSAARWRAGAAAGLVTALINLLVLGSVIGEAGAAKMLNVALLWVPTFLAAGTAVGGVAGVVATARQAVVRRVDWEAAFPTVAAASTLLLIVVGGLVTSHDAGLAVVDWPNTFGATMFLYPLSRMTGGIYLEHAHRLFGALVGLVTLVSSFRLLRRERRRAVRLMAVAAMAAVVGQGILGGLRVTGRFTLATDPAETAPNLALAAVHGVTAQLFFALLVALAVVTSAAWRRVDGGRRAERSWHGPVLLVALVVQLALGAAVRHFGVALLAHACVGAAVLGVAVLAAGHGRRSSAATAPLRPWGSALLVVAPVQVLLGVAAWLATAARAPGAAASRLEVIATTAHQVHGALFLGVAVAFTLWSLSGRRPAEPAS